MIFGWLRRRRRRKLLAEPFPSDWEALLEKQVFYPRLCASDRAALRVIVRVLVAEKLWTACGGLSMTDAIRVSIAAHAARLIFKRPHDFYDGTDEILVYPGKFYDPSEREERGGFVSEEGETLVGQAHASGPVILSWDETRRSLARSRDGSNVVLHEFAHRLDMADGWAAGVPVSAGADAWHALMERERKRLARGVGKVLDPYGADDPAEFFAVATEAFFEAGGGLKRERPELYDALMKFYGQDTAGG